MADRLITFILIALAAYRVAHLISQEDGPGNAAINLRAWVSRRLDTEIEPGLIAEHWLTAGLSCPLCLSFWLTLPAGLLAPSWPLAPLWWLAAAGIVLVLHRATK